MSEKKYKGLIIGRNPVNLSTGNGKTVASFFNNFDAKNLADLFVTDLPIDRSICDRYYRIDEKAIFTNFHNNTGEVEKSEELLMNIENRNAILKKIKSFLNNKLGLILRNYLWERDKWLTDELIKWFKDFSPDFVFYDAGNLPYEYIKIKQLKCYLKVPLIIYVSDDYITGKEYFLGKLYRKKMQDAFSDLAKEADLFILISEVMKKKLIKYITCKIDVAMNGADIQVKCIESNQHSNSIKIVYAGNCELGRWKILERVNDAIYLLQKEGIDITMEIYSSFNVSVKNKKRIEKYGVTKFCGSVYGDKLNEVRQDADILLHVESFRQKYKTILSSALSTKISEYMLLKRPILVIAPNYAESGNFIKRNEFGTVLNNLQITNITDVIKRISRNETKIKIMSDKAYRYAKEKMTSSYVADMIYQDINNICDNYYK